MGIEKGLVPDEVIGRHQDRLWIGRVNRSDTGYWWRAVECQEKPKPKFPIHSSFSTVVAYAIDEMIEAVTEFGNKDGRKESSEFELMSSLRPVSTDYNKRLGAEDLDDSKKVGTVRLSRLQDLFERLGIKTNSPFEALVFIMETDLTVEVADDDKSFVLPVGQSRHLVVKPGYGDFVIVPHGKEDYEWHDIRDALSTNVEAADRLLYSMVSYVLGDKVEYYQCPELVKTSIADIKVLVHEVNLALVKDTFEEVRAALPFTNVRTFLDSVAGTGVRVVVGRLWLDRGLAAITYDYGKDVSVYKPGQ